MTNLWSLSFGFKGCSGITIFSKNSQIIKIQDIAATGAAPNWQKFALISNHC
jgi:hypothetical protein